MKRKNWKLLESTRYLTGWKMFKKQEKMGLERKITGRTVQRKVTELGYSITN